MAKLATSRLYHQTAERGWNFGNFSPPSHVCFLGMQGILEFTAHLLISQGLLIVENIYTLASAVVAEHWGEGEQRHLRNVIRPQAQLLFKITYLQAKACPQLMIQLGSRLKDITRGYLLSLRPIYQDPPFLSRIGRKRRGPST